MDVPPLPADDPLARDTRARLFEVLGRLARAATTQELAAELDMHPNGVRRHLEQLQRSGLIRRTSIRQPRGRPKDGWSLDPDARPGGEEPRAYAELGRWLARSIPARLGSLREVEATGRDIGLELAESGLQDFEGALTWLGFSPSSESDGCCTTYTLGNCPYSQAVQENQAVVCTLHKGILSGLVETLEPGAEITAFNPRDPRTAGCTVDVQLPMAAADEEDQAA